MHIQGFARPLRHGETPRQWEGGTRGQSDLEAWSEAFAPRSRWGRIVVCRVLPRALCVALQSFHAAQPRFKRGSEMAMLRGYYQEAVVRARPIGDPGARGSTGEQQALQRWTRASEISSKALVVNGSTARSDKFRIGG